MVHILSVKELLVSKYKDYNHKLQRNNNDQSKFFRQKVQKMGSKTCLSQL